jgi:hypothetical protein
MAVDGCCGLVVSSGLWPFLNGGLVGVFRDVGMAAKGPTKMERVRGMVVAILKIASLRNLALRNET